MDDPDQQARKQRQAEALNYFWAKRPLTGCEYYKSGNSNHAPVEKFMYSLSHPKHQARFKSELDKLGNLGPEAGATKTKHVRGKIWEWRFEINSCTYRVFYAVNGNQKAVLLHAVVKAKERLLQKDIEAAESRWNDYQDQKQQQMLNDVKTQA